MFQLLFGNYVHKNVLERFLVGKICSVVDLEHVRQTPQRKQNSVEKFRFMEQSGTRDDHNCHDSDKRETSCSAPREVHIFKQKTIKFVTQHH